MISFYRAVVIRGEYCQGAIPQAIAHRLEEKNLVERDAQFTPTGVHLLPLNEGKKIDWSRGSSRDLARPLLKIPDCAK